MTRITQFFFRTRSLLKIFVTFHNFIYVWRYVTDTIAPPSAEHLIVRHLESLAEHVALHMKGSYVALMPFRDPVVQATIHEAKFMGNKKAHRLLGQVLAAYIQAQYTPDTTVHIVPVPLSPKRFRNRGYNQVAEVVRAALPEIPNAVLANRVLYRVRHTQAQTDLSRGERRLNVRGAFGVQKRSRSMNELSACNSVAYVLLDDVITTGATLGEACRALEREYGVTPACVALAH